jgi:hypothetical protein
MIISPGRATTLQLAEIMVSRGLFHQIMADIATPRRSSLSGG